MNEELKMGLRLVLIFVILCGVTALLEELSMKIRKWVRWKIR